MQKRVFYSIIIAFIAIVVTLLSGRLFEDADKSKNYVCQMPISGEYKVWTNGGLQYQGLGNLKSYFKTSQIEFTGLEKNKMGYTGSGDNPAAALTFSDKGKGYIMGSFRVIIPNDEQNMIRIQTDFGSEESLINNLIKPTLYKVITSCGPLMTSLQSVSENRTDLIQYITDQLNNGVYKTKVVKVETTNDITGEPEIINKSELIYDEKSPGGYKRQEVSPFSMYGIKCGLVSIIDIKYDAATQEQINAQKQANLAVITSKTKALEAQQRAIQVEEDGKAAAAKAKWEQETIKATEVTKAQQEFEVATLEAKKAQQVALRIKAEGEAKAAANRALVQAGLTPIEKATIEKETAIGIAEALAKSNVQWVPQVMLGNSNGNNSSAMDAVGLNMLMEITEKIKNNNK